MINILYLAPILAGISFNLLLAPVNEVSTFGFLGTYLGVNIFLFAYLSHTFGRSFLLIDVAINTIFVTSMVSITIFRRLYLSPLRKLPGIRLAAASKLYEVYLNSKGENSIVVRNLHRSLGDIIRTGPNEISINNPEVIAKLSSRGLPHNSRGPFYDCGKLVGASNLLCERNTYQHSMLRKIW